MVGPTACTKWSIFPWSNAFCSAVYACDGLHVWAGSFDSVCQDHFEVEDEFAAVIAEGVSGAA